MDPRDRLLRSEERQSQHHQDVAQLFQQPALTQPVHIFARGQRANNGHTMRKHDRHDQPVSVSVCVREGFGDRQKNYRNMRLPPCKRDSSERLFFQSNAHKKIELGQPPKITDQIGGNRRWGEPRAVSPQMAKLPPQYKTATDAIATTNTMAHIFSAVHRPINCSSSGERAALSSTHEFEADLCLWRLVRADLVRYFGPRHLKQSLARRSPNGFLLLRCFGAPPQDAPPRHTPRDA